MLQLTFPPKEMLTVSPHDTLPEAGRKVMLKFLEEMLSYEDTARLGEDIEGVHKMRVATRRLRSAYRVFEPYLSKPYREFLKPLRRTAGTLGEVRDLDVFILRTQTYIQETLGADPAPLQPLLEVLEAQHQAARAALMEWLNSPKYAKFIQNFHALLMQPIGLDHLRRKKASHQPEAFHVSHALPILVYERYHNVRRYENALETADYPTLHQLRIHAKRLRYTLDAFEDVLGVNGKRVVGGLKDLQEHLGDLNDCVVATERLTALLKHIPEDQREGTLAYQAAIQQELAGILKGMPRAWRKFASYQMRQALALAVARL